MILKGLYVVGQSPEVAKEYCLNAGLSVTRIITKVSSLLKLPEDSTVIFVGNFDGKRYWMDICKERRYEVILK